MCIGDWGAFMSEVFRYLSSSLSYHLTNIPSCTSPGGFAELGELGGITHSDDNTLHPGIARSFSLCAQAMEKIGRPFFTGVDLRQLLETAGFVDVVVENIKQPLGPWPRDERMKKVGAMNLLMGQTGTFPKGYSSPSPRIGGWMC
jgi:hypothetical protein